MSVTIYGASDDLIEIEGAIREEMYALENDGETGGVLAFSDGTVLSVKYDGFWRIHLLAEGTAGFSKTEGMDEDTDYSDRVTLTGDVHWIVFGSQFVKASA